MYSVGTSNRSIYEFVDLLRTRNVELAFDVRSKPYSRFRWFNQSQLNSFLNQANIEYLWLGAQLGGELDAVNDLSVIRSGVVRMLNMSENRSVAYFCAEGDPAQCHRSGVIGRLLLEQYGVVTENILRDGTVEDIDQTLCRMA